MNQQGMGCLDTLFVLAFGAASVVFGAAAAISMISGVVWLIGSSDNVMQQNARADLATAYFVLSALLMWVAMQFYRAAERFNK